MARPTAIGVTRSLDDPSRFKSISPERFLTEDGDASFQRRNRLVSVKPVRRRNHDAVQIVIEQLFERREEDRVRR